VNEPLTTSLITLLCLLAAAAASLALRRLFRPPAPPAPEPDPDSPRSAPASRGLERGLVELVLLGSLGLYLYRWMVLHGAWVPLEAHVDGLLLLGFLLAGTARFFQARPAMAGVAALLLPLLALVLAWAICASAWTMRPFRIDSAWQVVHLFAVYLGTLFLAVAAVSGGLFLVVRARLRAHGPAVGPPRLASLETCEKMVIRMATCGFAVLTLGLASGLVVVSARPETAMVPGWWYAPKIVLAAAVWLLYALVMNVRYATRFRGARAAWLSIAGMVLLLATFAIALAPGPTDAAPPAEEGGP